MRHEMRAVRLPWRSVDIAAAALVLICGLNLNGLIVMLANIGQTMSGFILWASLLLILKRGRAGLTQPTVLLLIAMVSYLLLGLLFYTPALSVNSAEKFLLTYVSSILIITAVAGYTACLPDGPMRDRFIRFVRNVFLVAAASVWASPLLYKIYVNAPPSAASRMAGFFGNPNEAAMVSLLAVAMVLTVPFRAKLLQWLMLFIAAGAVILTFSKTGMSCLIIILAWHQIYRLKGAILVLLPIVSVIGIYAIQDMQLIFETIAENSIVELDPSQKRRLLNVGQIVSGQINEDTSTGRTKLWGIVLERAWEQFPLGSGLGSAHNIIGGKLENGVWQGAHNTLIMMLGEAGPVPVVFLIAAIIILTLQVRRNSTGFMSVFLLLIILIDMFATHGTLGTRYHNLIYAFLLGIVARRKVMRPFDAPVYWPTAHPINPIDTARNWRASSPGGYR